MARKFSYPLFSDCLATDIKLQEHVLNKSTQLRAEKAKLPLPLTLPAPANNNHEDPLDQHLLPFDGLQPQDTTEMWAKFREPHAEAERNEDRRVFEGFREYDCANPLE